MCSVLKCFVLLRVRPNIYPVQILLVAHVLSSFTFFQRNSEKYKIKVGALPLELQIVADCKENACMFEEEKLLDGGDGFCVEPSEQVQRQVGASASLPGKFNFVVNPYVDRKSTCMGVRERHYTTHVRQTGIFTQRDQLSNALRDGLLCALVSLVDQDEIPDEDRVYFTLASNRLTNSYNGWGLTAGEWRKGGNRVDTILQHLSRLLNSNEQFQMNDSFQLSFTHVQAPPRGSGRPRKRKPGHQHPEVRKRLKQCEIDIPRTGNKLCCAKAIVTAKAFVDKHPKWESFRRGRRIQTKQAMALHEETDVPPGPCGYEELTAFSHAPSLYSYQLLLVDANRQFAVKAFGSPQPKQLVLLYEDNHYTVIKSLPAFFGTSYVCAHCYKGYNNEGHHKCEYNKGHCGACMQNGCHDFLDARARHHTAIVPCSTCHRLFYGNNCLKNHREHGQNGKPTGPDNNSVCVKRRKCPTCHTLLVGGKEQRRHRCGYADCLCCKEYVDIATHQCFVQVAKSPKQEREERQRKRHNRQRTRRGAAAGLKTLNANTSDCEEDIDDDGNVEKPPLHVFFDIEAMQMEGKHMANLVIAEREDDNEPVHFQGEHCLRNFLEWLDTLTENDTRKVTVIAHNFQGYDAYFVVFEYHRQNRVVKQLRNGAKFLQVVHDNIRFIDALSFFQFPLRAFSKTFGLQELKKGHFPHLFNTQENQEYVGPLPAKRHFMPEAMSMNDRGEFEKWHDGQVAKNVVFDFQKELVEYCQSDVKLLKEGCLQFKKLFEERSGFNPFDHVTIASACNHDLRQNRMAPQTIASEPLLGWRRTTNQSKVALEWLHWVNFSLNQTTNHPLAFHTPRLQHAGNGGDFRVPGSRYTVDGYDKYTNTVYEFHGCFWHGCQECYPDRHRETHARLLHRTFGEIYNVTQQKMQFLRNKGYKVVEMWECRWQRLKAEQEGVQEYVRTLNLVEFLNPRDAFYGGRTNAIKLYHLVDEHIGEEIHYYDYTSLYPFINKTARYPVGHPTIISQPGTNDISQYFGIIKCKILPPKNLYHPVLPYRHADKLLFPLCATCVEMQTAKPMLGRSSICDHNDDERTLFGTWCTPELEKAVELGYVIRDMHEVWHFAESRVGLFLDYVNTWLKIKTQAGGWPKDVGEDEAKRQQFLRDFEAREGISLEYDKMAANPGLRQLAKMMLNSMWGKFGQRPNKTQVMEFNDSAKFHRFLDTDKVDVRYVGVLNAERVEAHYKYQVEDDCISPNLNIFVAAFTTCWARLRLYEALELLQERILYFDTDSIFFIHRPDLQKPILGDFLGDFKDELDRGDPIVEFVSGGPKNYGYRTKAGNTECKVRGFSLTSEGLAHLNYEVLRQNTLDEIQKPREKPRRTSVPMTHQVGRNSKEYTLFTHANEKTYQLVYEKRVVNPVTFLTYPFGHTRLKDDDRH